MKTVSRAGVCVMPEDAGAASVAEKKSSCADDVDRLHFCGGPPAPAALCAVAAMAHRGPAAVAPPFFGSGDKGMQHALQACAARHPGNVAVRSGFDEQLAHLIEAGGGHLPYAVTFRAVRAESDVQSGLRHIAGGASHGRRPSLI